MPDHPRTRAPQHTLQSTAKETPMSSTATLAALAEKLNRANLYDPEPIFSQLYREYIGSADYDGWGPGGIGRVIEDMDFRTAPTQED